MSIGASGAAPRSDGEVLVDVPARARSLRLLRMAVADAAGDLDMDLDAVEAARIAVDELATVLLATAGWTRLVLRIDPTQGVLRVAGEATGSVDDVAEAKVDRVVEELLAVCVDEYEVSDGSSFWFTIAPRSVVAVGAQ